jgi:hypothetical protein
MTGTATVQNSSEDCPSLNLLHSPGQCFQLEHAWRFPAQTFWRVAGRLMHDHGVLNLAGEKDSLV